MPSTVYGDEDEMLSDFYISKNWEMYLQILDMNNPQETVHNYRGVEITLFARRWRPSTYSLEDFVNIPLVTVSRVELGRKLTEMSGLAADEIEIAKAPGTFPCEESVLSIHDGIKWVSLISDDGSTDFKWPVAIQSDGDVIFWRHKNEELKKLTEQERREIMKKENGDTDSISAATYSAASSPRKERPLRIFLDTPVSSVKEDAEPE